MKPVNLKKNVLACVLCGMLSFSSVRPVGDVVPTVGAVFAGLGAFLGGSVVSRIERFGGDYLLLPSFILTVGTAAAAYEFLSRFTPEGRLGRANCAISEAKTNAFLTRQFETEEDLIKFTFSFYSGNKSPLVSARKDLDKLRRRLACVRDLLVVASNEKKKEKEFCQLCQDLIAQIDAYLIVVYGLINIVSSNKYKNLNS